MTKFNLINDAWIPCLGLDNQRYELGIKAVLQKAHLLREIRADSPLETASILRLLNVVLQQITQIDNRAAWIRLWQDKQFDKSKCSFEYFDEWLERFSLFDDKKPFYQHISDDFKEFGTLNKLVFHIASDNAALLFEQTASAMENPKRFTFAEAARALITGQYFGYGFRDFVDAPCAKGISFWIWGDNLFETLLLNLCGKKHLQNEFPDVGSEDRPIWELTDDRFTTDAKEISNLRVPNGVLDYMTWPNRWIKLKLSKEGDCVNNVAWLAGLRLTDNIFDPMQIYTGDEENGWRSMTFSPDRALWRDSASLVEFSNVSKNIKQTAAFNWLRNQKILNDAPEIKTKKYRLAALGMCKDKAKVDFLRAEFIPLPGDFLDERELVEKMQYGLKISERLGYQLRKGVFNLARLLITPTTLDTELSDTQTDTKIKQSHDKSKDEEAKRIRKLAQSWNAEERYWGGLETHFHRFISDLPNDAERASDVWQGELKKSAQQAFKYVANSVAGDPRAHRAIAVASSQFEAGMKRIFLKSTDKTNKTEEVNHG